MILHKAGQPNEIVPVTSNKVGRRYDSLTLDYRDFDLLTRLRPQEAHEWLLDWMMGFPPLHRAPKEDTPPTNFVSFPDTLNDD